MWVRRSSAGEVLHNEGEADGGYLASAADLMIGLLFIFIILVVVLALEQRRQQEAMDKERGEFVGAGDPRGDVTGRIGDGIRLALPGIKVDRESGVPWSLLAAISSVESGFGSNMATSWAGAIGYGQFMPPSWAHWGEGDPYDYRDAIPAMARYLLDHNVLNDIPSAVYGYNHSWEYVALVLGRMAYYQAAFADAAAALGASTPPPPVGVSP